MSNVKGFLTALGFEVRTGGSQLQVDCPNCDDDKKHLYIAPANGLGYCHKCSYSPNPYMLVEKMTPKRGREVFEMLEQYGLADSGQDYRKPNQPRINTDTHGYSATEKTAAVGATPLSHKAESPSRCEHLPDLQPSDIGSTSLADLRDLTTEGSGQRTAYGVQEKDKEQQRKVPTAQGNKIMLSKDDTRSLTEQEIADFCRVKSIDVEALKKFRPFAHAIEPWVLLPAFTPGEDKACGWLRCRLDGEPIMLGGDNLVKYPIVAGSRHGLFGTEWIANENPDAVIFCEAWRDALAAMSIGLHATASSGGASTFSDDWLPIFTGKIVYICMDSDRAGQRAQKRAAERIATVAKDVYIVKLPYEVTESHGKDLHDYIVADGYGDGFLLHLSKAEKYECQKQEDLSGKLLLDDDHSDIIAEAFVKKIDVKYRYNSIDGWSICKDGVYERIDDENEVGVQIRRFLKKCLFIKKVGRNEFQAKIKPTNSKIKDIMGSLAALEGVHIPPELHAPASLSGAHDPDKIIALKNCLLDISGDKPVRIELTEDFYTFNYLPFDYDTEAECPRWEKFLGEIFTVKGDLPEWDEDQSDYVSIGVMIPDEEAAEILQEWFGYFITGWTYLQKIFGLIGPRRSGKSTIGKLIRALAGARNTASPTLTSLSTEFGLQPLLNKTIGIIGDANISGKASDVTRAVERLKSISGEDSQQINRKNKMHIEVDKLRVRFVIIANEMQDLRDSSGALASRFNFLVTTESFLDKEDTNLENDLLAEVPGVFNWALEGLVRLRQRGRLLEHPASVESRADFEAMSSPMTTFVEEWCEVGSDESVPIDALWKAHGDWSKSNGRGDGFSKQKFTNKIKSVVGGLTKDRRRIDLSILQLKYSMDSSGSAERASFYVGIDLKDDYKKRVDSMDSADNVWPG